MNRTDDVLTALQREGAGRSRSKRSRLGWIALGLALVAGLGGGAWYALVRTPAATWLTEEVRTGSLDVVVSAVGELAPVHQVTVGSEASGTVAEVLVDSNDEVDAGAILAVLDRSTLDAQRAQAKAQLALAEAQVVQAGVQATSAAEELARAERVGADALSSQALDRARTAARAAAAGVTAAKAQRAAAKAGLATLDTHLAKMVLRSPIHGTVLERHVEAGQAVISALQVQPLFRIAEDLGRMKVDVEVDEADVAHVRPGMAATFTVAAWPGRTFEASVVKVEQAPKAARAVVTYEAELAVDNEDRALLPGMTATASIVADTQEGALLVPAAALRFEPDDAAPADGLRVWVLRDGADEPVAVPVMRTGAAADRVAVTSKGLAPGDLVVVGTAEDEE